MFGSPQWRSYRKIIGGEAQLLAPTVALLSVHCCIATIPVAQTEHNKTEYHNFAMVQAENFNKIQPGNSVANQLDSEAKKKAEQNRKLLKRNTYCTLSWATSTHFCSLDLKLTQVCGTTKLRKLVIKLEFCLILHTANRDKLQTGPSFASPNYNIIQVCTEH